MGVLTVFVWSKTLLNSLITALHVFFTHSYIISFKRFLNSMELNIEDIIVFRSSSLSLFILGAMFTNSRAKIIYLDVNFVYILSLHTNKNNIKRRAQHLHNKDEITNYIEEKKTISGVFFGSKRDRRS